MEIRFPCGAKGRPEFCPDLCNYGTFCKLVKDQASKPRGLQEEEPVEEIRDEDVSDVEFYY